MTPATDVFSLGATLAYAATADSPFGHGSSEVMLYRVVHEEAQLQGVPDALAPLVRACLAKDPDERPSTLQLSMRLKEIAAREAQGLPESRPPAQRERREQDMPTGRMTERYTQRTGERPSDRGAERGGERTGERGSERGTDRGSERGHDRGGERGSERGPQGRTSGTSGGSAARPPASRGSSRRSGGSGPQQPRGASRTGGRRNGAPRKTSGGRRPANPRLLRQRLIVFFVVTLIVALGIAAAQQL